MRSTVGVGSERVGLEVMNVRFSMLSVVAHLLGVSRSKTFKSADLETHRNLAISRHYHTCNVLSRTSLERQWSRAYATARYRPGLAIFVGNLVSAYEEGFKSVSVHLKL